MNGHLDSEAICSWVAGQGSAETERHLLECVECARAVGRLEAGISGFRDSAYHWSEEVRPPAPAAAGPAPARRWRGPFALAGLAACLTAAAILVAVPVERGRERQAAARAAEQARADAQLLEKVDAAISRSAPAPMEPLFKLVQTTGEE